MVDGDTAVAKKQSTQRLKRVDEKASMARGPDSARSMFKRTTSLDCKRSPTGAASFSGESGDQFVYPEGGLRAWSVVFGSWCGLFASLGITNTLASFHAFLSINQLSSYTSGQIGWIFSVYTFLLFACGIYIGPLFDVYGPRWLVLPGSICMVLTIFLLGICSGSLNLFHVSGMLCKALYRGSRNDLLIANIRHSVLALYASLWCHRWARKFTHLYPWNRCHKPLFQSWTR